ncbi:acylneuraminate cytidylyltransferase family protein [Shewanella sp. CG12_big_fil_rev_8_21_14_0_65_47_15]|uniref:acylneuraminate cytidylyltransferase family protein n=1 Tax=Shewanella sp. CG12_big_fil_rev_8_21_14_0_65_47_15 TaxID=1975537 RepID=UPI000CC8DF41|nr:acylneuraminate cytidylyltransferase family protein [Shewanella sp. CG12_big_fil_rev_8_21_14_0_65_47_15]PIW60928.1 MAG: CMP-N-acetlyneuraminic acid synthetase [Shewanella sp. CG12_big_fil_rev_8_21_14_0_65_47_15]
MNKRVLALIPARAGSKRIVNKNIKPFAGKPLIAWTIEAAKACENITDVVVSTDGEDIAAIARQYGAETPFIRPDILSSDTASSIDVVLHAVDFLSESGRDYDLLLLLQPTSPLRGTSDISTAIDFFRRSNAQGVISVCECEHSPLWANILPESKSLDGFISPEISELRSQDLPVYYRFNGAIYLFDVQQLQLRKSFFYSQNVFAHVMNKEDSIDIDTEIDFQFGEFLASKK